MQLESKSFAGAFSYYSDGSRSNPVSYLYAQDLNKDGVDEVLFVAFETQPNTPSQYSNTSVHIFGWQEGTFKEVTNLWLPGDSNRVEGVGDVAFGDFNGDGLKDIFLSAYTDMDYPVNAYVLYNTGAGFNKVSMGLQTWQHSVRSYDINQDGYDDVIPVGYADMPRYMGSGNGLVKFSGFTGGSGLALGDFMKTGKASVIFVDAGRGLSDTYLYNFDFLTPGFVSVNLVSQLPGPRLESIAPTASSHDIRAVPFDFNDDGLLDVITIGYGFGLNDTAVHRSEIQFLVNKGNGVFEDATPTYRIGFDVSGNVGYTPQVLDVNQDGRLDLFLSQPDWLPKYNSTTLLLQQQNSTFVDTARSILTSAIDSGGGQGILVQGPNKAIYLVTEGAWNWNNPQTTVYSQKIIFPERELPEVLFGTLQNDTIMGFGGNDQLQGNFGNDALDGGSGNDTAAYIGILSNYTLTKGANTYTVTDKTGVDGVDTLTNIERLQFTDKTINLTVQAKAASAPQADVTRLVELYTAFFNRVPDADGMSFWIDEMKAGKTTNQVAEAFYNAGVNYSSLTGFSSTMKNADFINVIYKNVLGRKDGADAGGLSFWETEITSGRATRGTLVTNILDSAHTFKGDKTWGWVADLLDNKITVAKKFSIDMGLNYNTPEESITKGMAIASAITPTDTSAAVTLIGVTEANFLLV